MSVHLRTKGFWVRVQLQSDFAPASSKEFFDIQATTECGFTLKRAHDMIRTYSQMHRTYKYSQHSAIIWPVWLNSCVFVYELSGCRFESSCSHLVVIFTYIYYYFVKYLPYPFILTLIKVKYVYLIIIGELIIYFF